MLEIPQYIVVWVNDETYLNVESGRLLEEGTFECRNVGKDV